MVRFVEKHLPKLLLSPTLVGASIFLYGLIGWTSYISLTSSRFLPKYDFVGLSNYFQLFRMERWIISCQNIIIFTVLYIGLSIFLGLILAIFLDQKIRFEGFIKSVYLYPMALSFIVTGTIWKWIFNPAIGLEKFVHLMGFTQFKFDWAINPKLSLYAVILAALWQSCGFVMAIFLSGLRGIDQNIIKAAQMDGADSWTIYTKILIPMLRPVFFTAFVLTFQTSIKSFDIVVGLTGGGPGFSSELPATFMFDYSFERNRLAIGAASSILMLMSALTIVVPYIYSELRGKVHG